MINERERLTGNDEIDLIELVRGIWRQKVLVVGTAVALCLASVVYVLLATPIYEAKIFVLQPTQNDIAHLNYGRGGDTDLKRFTVKEIYEVYLRHLQSEALRRTFFQTVYLPTLSREAQQGSQDDLYRRFNKLLVVAPSGKDNPNRFSITANVSNPRQAVEWVTDYVRMAGERAKQEVLKNTKSEATVKANNLQQQVGRAQESARKLREDQIVQLNEALLIAKSIGLEKPPIISRNQAAEISADMEGPLTFMRGSNALEAEISNLQARKSDDPFIRGIRKQQTALAFYRAFSIDPEAVAVYRQDGVVELPDTPIKPDKSRVVMLGAVFGLILGVGLALLRNLYRAGTRAHHKE
ncbi:MULTISPECIES: LPS O-antigen chain length determinant protein WzzB [unclassified Pseudomonas]|uniref:LPS O-antigen chain length determinant protein WzzB n=1 Tax=unclassified Pseudomonas TaxID=196821 RepID=UPI002096C31E|nr:MULTISPECIES: Wzz/FepE/Etk N-terminal domain-containing protein [unclassified Pseudomonas]MCO7506519.1 Wzz/FepE/Etk N-terminal domain-containing protein [Pseudomonas sp. VE 267-6A]MCO7531786.1 Wzz/FepE/Etk N-terminal domain-containing protein [Pseudomonas sp. 2]